MKICAVLAAAALWSFVAAGCAGSGRLAHPRSGGDMLVRATAVRITGSDQAQRELAAMVRSDFRAANPMPYASETELLAALSKVADVEVLGSPTTTLTGSTPGSLHVTGAGRSETGDFGFLAGVNTDVRLSLERSDAPRGMLGLKAAGSILQFTPDKSGDQRAASVHNAAYTRMRDFETEVSLRPGQPVVLTTPALIEQGPGLWTGVVVILTTEPATSAVAEAAE